jgi:DDE family transposase
MENPTGESTDGVLRLDFDRKLTLQFRGSVLTSDAGLLAHRELDDALGLTTMAGEMLAEARTGRNGRHALVGLFRQSVFGRLAGYEDVNDAERLPAHRRRADGAGCQMGSLSVEHGLALRVITAGYELCCDDAAAGTRIDRACPCEHGYIRRGIPSVCAERGHGPPANRG